MVANKRLNETTEVVRDVKRQRLYTLVVFIVKSTHLSRRADLDCFLYIIIITTTVPSMSKQLGDSGEEKLKAASLQ